MSKHRHIVLFQTQNDNIYDSIIMYCKYTCIVQHFTSLSHYLFYHFERGMKNWCLILDEERAKKCQTFLQHPNVRKFILRFKEQLAHNPFLQVATCTALASLLVPIFLFIIFGIVSAVFVFIGFMIVQGKQSYISYSWSQSCCC